MKSQLIFVPLFLSTLAASAVTVDFEDLTVPTAGYYIGADSVGSFTSDGVSFAVDYNATYGSWSGIAYSNLGYDQPTSSEYTSSYYTVGQYKTVGTLESAQVYTYAVVYDPGAYGTSPVITLPDGLSCPASIIVTNCSYTWASMTYGDSFAGVFETGDWLLLTITGYDASNTSTGSVDFYLADFRSATASEHNIVTAWTSVDLSDLGTGVKTIKFVVTSSDYSTYSGVTYMNTPTYFDILGFEAYGTYLWSVVNAWDSTWYGHTYAFQNGEGWFYSEENGNYQYGLGTSDGAMWVYDREMGWYYTSHDTYPYIYLSGYDMWAYFYADDESAERWYCVWADAQSSNLPDYPYATDTDIVGLTD